MEKLFNFTIIFQAILAGLVLTLGTCWLGVRIARRFGLLDIPGSAPHKLHQVPMPYAGGIALGLTLAILVGVTGLWRLVEVRFLLVSTSIVFIFGLVDDSRRLTPRVKFLGQILAAIILILSGTSIQIFQSHTFFIGGSQQIFVWLDRILTVFWMVGITNAFNLVDSMDGLAVGLAAWAFGFFMLATFESGQNLLSFFSAITLGACVSIYLFNSSPARLFLGDSGAQSLGFLLAGLAILYNPLDKFQTSSYLVPILLMGVPIFDTSLVTFSRLRRGRAFYQANRDHTYHRLVSLGLEPSRSVLVMHTTAIILDCLAFIAVSLQPIYANGLLVAVIIIGVLCLLILDRGKVAS